MAKPSSTTAQGPNRAHIQIRAARPRVPNYGTKTVHYFRNQTHGIWLIPDPNNPGVRDYFSPGSEPSPDQEHRLQRLCECRGPAGSQHLFFLASGGCTPGSRQERPWLVCGYVDGFSSLCLSGGRGGALRLDTTCAGASPWTSGPVNPTITFLQFFSPMSWVV